MAMPMMGMVAPMMPMMNPMMGLMAGMASMANMAKAAKAWNYLGSASPFLLDSFDRPEAKKKAPEPEVKKEEEKEAVPAAEAFDPEDCLLLNHSCQCLSVREQSRVI